MKNIKKTIEFNIEGLKYFLKIIEEINHKSLLDFCISFLS